MFSGNLHKCFKPFKRFAGQRSVERTSCSCQVFGSDAAPAAEPEQQPVHQVGGGRHLIGQQVKNAMTQHLLGWAENWTIRNIEFFHCSGNKIRNKIVSLSLSLSFSLFVFFLSFSLSHSLSVISHHFIYLKKTFISTSLDRVWELLLLARRPAAGSTRTCLTRRTQARPRPRGSVGSRSGRRTGSTRSSTRWSQIINKTSLALALTHTHTHYHYLSLSLSPLSQVVAITSTNNWNM